MQRWQVSKGPADGRGLRLPLAFWALLVFSLFAMGLGVLWLLTDQGVWGSGGMSAGAPVITGKNAPAAGFELADLSGRRVRLSDLRGKVVLLNFWATWCPPCKAEMPDLQAISDQYGQQRDLVVLGVDVEENLDAAQAFAKQYNVTFPLLPDSDGKVSSDLYKVRALPTSFIIDRDGVVRSQWTGQQTRNRMVQSLEKVW